METVIAKECAVLPVSCRTCQATEDLYRCLYCMTQPIYCSAEMREYHELTPFHRIEKWTGTHFQPAWLSEVGLKIYLGHQGNPCPNGEALDFTDVDDSEDSANEGASSEQKKEQKKEEQKQFHPIFGVPRRCWIVDVSGIHSLEVVFCSCSEQRGKHIQLLNMDLWPASFVRVKTLFTFRLLSDFRLDNLEAQTSAYHYFAKLRRITNPAFPAQVPVCVYILSS